jgi:hypothetical protein
MLGMCLSRLRPDVTIHRHRPSLMHARARQSVCAQGLRLDADRFAGHTLGETMNRLVLIAGAGLMVAAPASAMTTRIDAPRLDAALDVNGASGVLQQGRGGGKQEEAGGRGQGGGDARPSSDRRQGGGQSARSTERRQQPDRAESGRGRSSSSGSSETRRSSGGSGRTDDAREGRGNSSSSSSSARSERGSGNGSSSASSREERGNGGGNARASSNGNAGANGSARASDARGGRHRLSGADLRRRVDALPAGLRRMAASSRPSERMVAGAIARGHGRGLDANAFDVRDSGGRLSIFNRGGQLLLDLDDDRARQLGGWQLRRMGDRQPAGNAPAFCRSGQGHPVFGREWCLDRGHGLGSRQGTIWSRGGIDDVTWRRRTDDRLDCGGLVGVLGDIVLGRLAFQAISLGYDQPLVGSWVAQPEGPRILRVSSGDYEVAELVDTDRDDRVDVLYVVQPVW